MKMCPAVLFAAFLLAVGDRAVHAQNPQPPQPLKAEKIRDDLRYFGPCHTDGDTFVYFPADKVLTTGDCFNTGNGRGLNPTGSTTPGLYADYAINGSLLGFPNSADASLKLDWDAVIPGHGPSTNRASFLKWRKDVETIIDRVRSMTRAGRTKTDIEQVLIEEFGWEPTGNPIRSLDAVMAELKQ
jgi:glyoxylase-like metal-dependent hydrolase (beta-lactamase superfamily II)